MRHYGLGQEVACLFSMPEKLDWFQLTVLITLVLSMWKWMGMFLRKNQLGCWGWLSLLNWIGAYIICIAITASKNIGALIHSMKFLSLWLLRISINLPYTHAWNTVVTSALVPVAATWNCWISYENGYSALSVLHLLPLLNPWFIIKM